MFFKQNVFFKKKTASKKVGTCHVIYTLWKKIKTTTTFFSYKLNITIKTHKPKWDFKINWTNQEKLFLLWFMFSSSW